MGFLSRSDPIDLTLLLSLWKPLVLHTVVTLGNFLAEQHFTYVSYHNTLVFNST